MSQININKEEMSEEAHQNEETESYLFCDLQKKLQNLREFIQSLGTQALQAVPKDFLEQAEMDPENYLELTGQALLIEADKRIEKIKKARKPKKNWGAGDMSILIWVIYQYAIQRNTTVAAIQGSCQAWEMISDLIPGTTASSCMFRWLSQKRYKITLHRWKTEEQNILLDLEEQIWFYHSKYRDNKNKWKFISEDLYNRNPDPTKIYRHPKQCREHFASFLNPKIIKGLWTEKQDYQLLSYIYETKGKKRWCKLATILEGRTENAIKNRFKLICDNFKKKKEKTKSQMELIYEYLQDMNYQAEKKHELPEPQKPKETVQVLSSPKSTIGERTPISSNQNLNISNSNKTIKGFVSFVPYNPESLHLEGNSTTQIENHEGNGDRWHYKIFSPFMI